MERSEKAHLPTRPPDLEHPFTKGLPIPTVVSIRRVSYGKKRKGSLAYSTAGPGAPVYKRLTYTRGSLDTACELWKEVKRLTCLLDRRTWSTCLQKAYLYPR